MINKSIYLILFCSFLVGQDSLIDKSWGDWPVDPPKNLPYDYRRDIYRVSPDSSEKFQIWLASENGLPLRIEGNNYYAKAHPSLESRFKIYGYLPDAVTDDGNSHGSAWVTWGTDWETEMELVQGRTEKINNVNKESYAINGIVQTVYKFLRTQKLTGTWHYDNSRFLCDHSKDIVKTINIIFDGYTSEKFRLFLTPEANLNPRDDFKKKSPFFRAFVAIELSQKGYTYAEKKEYDSAIAYYLKAIELDPDIGYVTYANLGLIYLEQDNYTEAIQNYEKTIELKPDYGEAYHNLGFAHQENGDLETGLIYYKKAARLGVKEIQSWLKENGYKW